MLQNYNLKTIDVSTFINQFSLGILSASGKVVGIKKLLQFSCLEKLESREIYVTIGECELTVGETLHREFPAFGLSHCRPIKK